MLPPAKHTEPQYIRASKELTLAFRTQLELIESRTSGAGAAMALLLVSTSPIGDLLAPPSHSGRRQRAEKLQCRGSESTRRRGVVVAATPATAADSSHRRAAGRIAAATAEAPNSSHLETLSSQESTAQQLLDAVQGLPLEELMSAAAALRDSAHRHITFSPKVFIPLTRLCRDR